jgi:PAS domain S-box-containing protein
MANQSDGWESTKGTEQSQDFFQYIIEHDPTAIAVLNRELEYVFVSRRFREDFGVMDRDIRGMKHYDVFPSLPGKWKEAHRKALLGETVEEDEDTFINSEGNVEWIRWECRPWYENDSLISGIILYIEIITEKKKTELELLKAKEKAEESDKLKTSFLQNISHEVRTPLNSIVGFAELLSQPGQSLQKLNSFSKIISANSQKLIRIISDVIEISQIHSGQVFAEISKFDVVSVLYKISNNFVEISQLKEIDFIIDNNVTTDHSIIESDKSKIEKIFYHIIDNAVKFTQRGSIRVSIELASERLYFIVKDTGTGIPRDKQKMIFNPFSQLETGLNASHGGTGLGLAIVRAYVNSLKGNIALSSRVSKGTEVKIDLPVKIAKEKQSGPGGTRHGDSVTIILIAEDEYSNFRYLYEVLHSDDIEILHAKNGMEAVEMCRKTDDIKMILMDMKMPLMDGASAARQIKSFRPDIPIIAQSSFIREGEYLNTIFDDLIAKPINRADLKEKMSRFITVD